MPKRRNAGKQVSPATAFLTGSNLCQTRIGIPGSGLVRYGWSRISPALPSLPTFVPIRQLTFDVCLSSKCSTCKQTQAECQCLLTSRHQLGENRGGIFKLLSSPGIESKESFRQPCSLAGRYDNPIPTRILAPIDCSKIPALLFLGKVHTLWPLF
jgi:hypothetical protein